jgi:glycerol-3-phosphate O-acyltransferase
VILSRDVRHSILKITQGGGEKEPPGETGGADAAS